MTRAAIAFLLLVGLASADQIRIDWRDGTTGNYAPIPLTTVPNNVLTFDTNGNPIIGPAAAGGVTDGDKGGITVAGSGATWTVNPGHITLARMANLAQGMIIGRATGGLGVPEAITLGADFNLTGTALGLAVAPQPLNANLTDLAGLTAAQGDIVIGNGAGDWTKLTKGTALQVLRMNAGATLPEWAAAAAGGIAAGDSPTWTGAHTFTRAGAASAPTISLTGLPFTGGDATTTKPLLLIEPTGTTSTGWGTTGTMLGVNAASGFAGNLIDAQLNGAARFRVNSAGAVLVPAGTNALPSVAMGVANTGFWSASPNFVSCSSNGTEAWVLHSSSGGYRLLSSMPFGWASGSPSGTLMDAGWARLGAANIRQGLVPSATPVAQTFTLGEASRPGTDSNVAGANGTLQSGLGTGTGTASSLVFQTPTVAASGSTVQTQTTRLTLAAAGATFATPVLLPQMTKTARNALTAVNGMMIYQSDSTPGLRVYENGAWVKYTSTADP